MWIAVARLAHAIAVDQGNAVFQEDVDQLFGERSAADEDGL